MTGNISTDFVMEQIVSITGVKATLDEAYNLLELDQKDRLQVRIDRNNAPQEMVDRFRFQMSQSEFPPIVVTKDRRTIDGNTRVKARLARDEIRVPALVVPISWDEAEADQRERLLLLGLALNNVNGKPLDEDERHEMIRHALNVGLSDAQIMYQIGVDAKTIRAVRAEHDAKLRLKEVGRETDGLKPAAMKALGRSEITALDDDSYRDLASLASDAQFKAGEVTALAASLRDLSPDLRTERIAREREAQAQRITDVTRGGNGHPPYARQLRARLKSIAETEHPADVFVEHSRDDMDEHVRLLRGAITLLTAVLELQLAETAQ